jgi:hypothetical protein
MPRVVTLVPTNQSTDAQKTAATDAMISDDWYERKNPVEPSSRESSTASKGNSSRFEPPGAGEGTRISVRCLGLGRGCLLNTLDPEYELLIPVRHREHCMAILLLF